MDNVILEQQNFIIIHQKTFHSMEFLIIIFPLYKQTKKNRSLDFWCTRKCLFAESGFCSIEILGAIAPADKHSKKIGEWWKWYFIFYVDKDCNTLFIFSIESLFYLHDLIFTNKGSNKVFKLNKWKVVTSKNYG